MSSDSICLFGTIICALLLIVVLLGYSSCGGRRNGKKGRP